MFTTDVVWQPFKVDAERYKRSVRAAMHRLWRDALGEFVTAIVFDDLIGVDTGESAATLHDVAVEARIWGAVKNVIRLKRKRIKARGVKSASGSYDRSRYRSIKTGMEVSDGATTIKSYGMDFSFSFKIVTFQWYYHEVLGGEGWNALEIAGSRMINFINEHSESYMPDISELIR